VSKARSPSIGHLQFNNGINPVVADNGREEAACAFDWGHERMFELGEAIQGYFLLVWSE
jgi:hypothetical protein